MALTAVQKAKIKKILTDYRREVRAIVTKHKTEISKAVEDLDKQKADKIKKTIERM